MKMKFFSILSKAALLCALTGFFAAPAFSYIPPLGPISYNVQLIGPSSFYMHASVYDPIRGVTKNWLSAVLQGAPSQVSTIVYDNILVIGFVSTVQYSIIMVTYDPKRGDWVSHSEFPQVGSLFTISLNNGVVGWHVVVTGNWTVGMATYEPRATYGGTLTGDWKTYTAYMGSASNRDMVLDHGVVAWRWSSGGFYQASFSVYDPVSQSWKTSSQICNSSYLSLSNGSVTLDQYINGIKTFGYDPYTAGGSWQQGTTKSLSAFVFQNVGSTGILTDMSIIPSSSSWNLGDTITSTARSLTHAYSISPPFTVNLDITGLDGVLRNSSVNVVSF